MASLSLREQTEVGYLGDSKYAETDFPSAPKRSSQAVNRAGCHHHHEDEEREVSDRDSRSSDDDEDDDEDSKAELN